MRSNTVYRPTVWLLVVWLLSCGPTNVLSPGTCTDNSGIDEKGLGRDLKKKTVPQPRLVPISSGTNLFASRAPNLSLRGRRTKGREGSARIQLPLPPLCTSATQANQTFAPRAGIERNRLLAVYPTFNCVSHFNSSPIMDPADKEVFGILFSNWQSTIYYVYRRRRWLGFLS